MKEQMMNELETLRKKFLDKLNEAVNAAENEEDMDELESVAANTLSGIPIQLLQSDFYPRSTIKNLFIAKDKKEDKEYVDKVMKKIWQNDCICFYDDNIQQDVTEAIEELD